MARTKHPCLKTLKAGRIQKRFESHLISSYKLNEIELTYESAESMTDGTVERAEQAEPNSSQDRALKLDGRRSLISPPFRRRLRC